MEIRWLRAAVAVAEHLHFGRAGASLGIAQSQISQQVAALERDLGTRLFDRDSRNVAPTPAGAAFITDARAALERLDAAAERARAVGRGEHGTLAIGTVGSALSAPLPRLLRAYRERFRQSPSSSPSSQRRSRWNGCGPAPSTSGSCARRCPIRVPGSSS